MSLLPEMLKNIFNSIISNVIDNTNDDMLSVDKPWADKVAQMQKAHPDWDMDKINETIWNNDYQNLLNAMANSNPDVRDILIIKYQEQLIAYQKSGIDVSNHLLYLGRKDIQGIGTIGISPEKLLLFEVPKERLENINNIAEARSEASKRLEQLKLDPTQVYYHIRFNYDGSIFYDDAVVIHEEILNLEGKIIRLDERLEGEVNEIKKKLNELSNNDVIVPRTLGAYTEPNDTFAPSTLDTYAPGQGGGGNRDQAVVYALINAQNTNHHSRYYYFSRETAGGSNCANFVSQCLYAGGMPMTAKWFWDMRIQRTETIKIGGITIIPSRGNVYGSGAWLRSDDLYRYLTETKNFSKSFISIRNGIEGTPEKNYQNIVDAVKLGDVIAFNNMNRLGDSEGYINHIGIVTAVEDGEIYFSAHSDSRRNKSLKEVLVETGFKGDLYFVHIQYESFTGNRIRGVDMG